MPTDEKKNHDYRVSCLCFYIHVYGIPDYRKRFAWIKPYNDVIYHVLNMKSCCVVLVNYKPIRYFTTNQRYQSSASVSGWQKYCFHGMDTLKQVVLESGRLSCTWRVSEHSRRIKLTRFISLDQEQHLSKIGQWR